MILSPTPLAYVALVCWIPIVLLLFASLKPANAAAVSFLGSILLLPVHLEFNLPGLPGIDRETIAGLSAFAALVIFHARSLRRWKRLEWPTLLVIALAVTPFITASTNGDPVQYGPWSAPGLTWYDGAGVSFYQMSRFGIPFLIGCHVVRNVAALRSVMTLIVVAALAYSILMAWELRMAPTLHRDLYGYHPHGFAQHVRAGGGYRPMVFSQTGLYLSMFILSAAMFAAALGRARLSVRGVPALPIAIYLTVVLVLAKSLGASLYGFVMVPVLLLTRPRTQAILATLLLAVIVSWPMLRGGGFVPTERLVSLARNISVERAHSLDFRFEQEDQLFALARERIWCGWGGWGRSRVHDPRTGEDVSVTDGFWIIALGRRGIIGAAATFGLLLLPVATAIRRYGTLPSRRGRILVLSMALVVSVQTLDLLLNTTISNFSLFLSGALLGSVSGTGRKDKRPSGPKQRGRRRPPLAERSDPALGRSLLSSGKGTNREPGVE